MELHFLPLAPLGYWLISDSCWGFDWTIRYTVDTDGSLRLNWEPEVHTVFTRSQTWFLVEIVSIQSGAAVSWRNGYHQPSWTRPSRKCAIERQASPWVAWTCIPACSLYQKSAVTCGKADRWMQSGKKQCTLWIHLWKSGSISVEGACFLCMLGMLLFAHL